MVTARTTSSSILTAILVVAIAGCGRREPPAWDSGTASLAAVALMVPGPPSKVDASAAPAPAASAIAVEGHDAGVDSGALPQTEDKPEASGAAFDARTHALWDAIVADDPDRAMPFFFPLAAYEQVKAITNPGSDWRRRLVAAYARDIHALHARLGASAASARFVTLEVPSDRARWVKPGEEYNKIGYYRVFGSKLRFTLEGAAKSFDVTSLISWRGEWFVVHLSSIR